jgi:hypothetical protein
VNRTNLAEKTGRQEPPAPLASTHVSLRTPGPRAALGCSRVVEYTGIWISRKDREDLSAAEMAGFEKVVADELRFDCGEDELTFWFDPDTHEGILKASVPDVFDDEAQDDDLQNVLKSTTSIFPQ